MQKLLSDRAKTLTHQSWSAQADHSRHSSPRTQGRRGSPAFADDEIGGSSRRLACVATAFAAIVAFGSVPWCVAHAGVTPQEAEQLKTTLTPLGAERKGNAEGTIPAWTGGYTIVPPGYQSGAPRPDPFAAEPPRLTITRANLAAQQDKLAAGTLELFKRYADFQVLVYPTHRTAAAPQFVYDNTFHNATAAQTADGGNSVLNAHGGIPFPIAKTGNEMMWNALLYWRGVAFNTLSPGYIVTPDGQKALSNSTEAVYEFPYYQDNPGDLAGVYQAVMTKNLAPAYMYGQAILALNMLNPVRDGQPGWQYLVGQRRVRKAPNLQYDTPDFIVSGLINFDEISGFTGAMDRYGWKILGKREYFFPYNTNKLTQLSANQQIGPHFPVPQNLRWELHRVWVVEGDLLPGARHVVPRRVLYLDEDTWQILGEDEYDATGGLWKYQLALPLLMPEIPAVASIVAAVVWDFHSGSYLYGAYTSDEASNVKVLAPVPGDFFTPDSLAARGTR
jgi:NAD(P)-dependent dehydrogenase (short-subunit alcohol dehydrogenase family)